MHAHVPGIWPCEKNNIQMQQAAALSDGVLGHNDRKLIAFLDSL